MAQVNFTLEDWERIERDHVAWWAGELERPLVLLSGIRPLDRPRPFGRQASFPLAMPAEQVVEQYAEVMAKTTYYADAFPRVWTDFGPGIMAGFLGADVHAVTEPLETVWFTPKADVPISALKLHYDPANVWLARVKAITAAFRECYGDLVSVAMTDLGGNLDILASLRTTERLLIECLEEPEEVGRLVREITALWVRYYDEIDALIRPAGRGTTCWTPIWSPGKTYMLQCDFSYMIGPRMFERFVVPDLSACCDHLDHGFYHLDGKGEIPHLDHLLAIPRLRGIQWIPGDGQPSPDQWLSLLKRIRDGGKLCQVFVKPDGARRIVQNLGGKGFMLVIQGDGRPFDDPEVAHAFLRTLAEEDITLQ